MKLLYFLRKNVFWLVPIIGLLSLATVGYFTSPTSLSLLTSLSLFALFVYDLNLRYFFGASFYYILALVAIIFG